MKKTVLTSISLLIIILANLLISTSLFGQAPESFSYQAIIRDNTGQSLPNASVTIQFNILQGSASGTTVYSEDQATTTNGFGLVNLQIGQGTVNSGTFSAIDWGGDAYFLNVQIDQGSGFVDMGTQQFISVPYALFAKTTGNVNDADADSTNELQTLSVNGNQLSISGSGGNTVTMQVAAAGNSGDVQLNDNGTIGADPDLHWDFAGKKLVVGQDTSDGRMIIQQDANAPDSIPILEVKNKLGQTIFVIYPDSVHIFIDDDNTKGVLKGGFAVSGRSGTKAPVNDYLLVRPDSTRIYFNESGAKGVLKGGFAVSGRSGTKSGVGNEYFNISAADTAAIVNPSEPRIMWYPKKEAFLTGRVLIEHADSVGTNSMATGFESKAVGDFSQAMGYKTIARGQKSTSIGDSSIARGFNSYAFGSYVLAADTNSYAFGQESAALAKGAFVFGQGDTASAESAMALGYNNKAQGVASLALGAYTTAIDTLSVAMGYATVSEGLASVAMGDATHASGDNSLALGSQTIASGETSTAMGNQTIASGISSIAMGHVSYATGTHAIAMGDSTLASNDDATSMGYKTTAEGMFSTSMGYITTAHGQSSFAVGIETAANGDGAIAMGSNTIANGNSSLAIGQSTTTGGEASVAIGINSVAQGDASVAYGISTNATAMGSFVIGSFNEAFSPVNSTSLNDDLFVVANGVSGTPHNAFTILKVGNVGINTNIPDKLLTVNGDARVTGDIYYGAIGSPTTYSKPDFVFSPDYNKDFDILNIEKFIKKHNHLPWVTAAKDEKEGINMTRMSFQTLEAVENQQLQIIELKKENENQQKIIENLLKRIEKLEKRK